MPTIEHGLSVYYKYYKKEDEEKFGVVAIRLELLNDTNIAIIWMILVGFIFSFVCKSKNN